MISFKCSKCGYQYKVDDIHAGKKARCKSCENVNTIPGAAVKPAVIGHVPGSGDTVAAYNSLLQELLKQEKTAPSVETDAK